MSGDNVTSGPLWQRAAYASDRITELMDEIPGWDGYEHAEETLEELRRAVALLQKAITLLEQARRGEAKREETRR